MQLGRCLQPTLWNQAGYDLVRFLPQSFGKSSRSQEAVRSPQSHDLDLRHLRYPNQQVVEKKVVTSNDGVAAEIYVLVPFGVAKPNIRHKESLRAADGESRAPRLGRPDPSESMRNSQGVTTLRSQAVLRSLRHGGQGWSGRRGAAAPGRSDRKPAVARGSDRA